MSAWEEAWKNLQKMQRAMGDARTHEQEKAARRRLKTAERRMEDVDRELFKKAVYLVQLGHSDEQVCAILEVPRSLANDARNEAAKRKSAAAGS